MPVYEYECTSCGERFEIRRRIADSDGEIDCPKCQAKNPRRVLSVFAKGSSGEACAPSSPT